jgi:carbon starvation protein
MSLWKKLLWISVTLLGLGSIAILAMSRGEQINALWIVVAGLCAFAISYRFYSKWLASKVLLLNDQRATPALVQNDGKDFVPTNRWMVFGHHFAAIAGPGPLVGPVLAAQFGFLPGTLWILIGATLGGGVHDMIVLFASVRRRGKTLGHTRIDQRARHHDHFARSTGAGGGAGVGKKSLGCLHHRDDHSPRFAHGRRIAQ